MADPDKSRAFLGTGWSFPPQFLTGKRNASLVTGEDDIQESLRILFSTVPGERIMLPQYGCGLKALVFESIDDELISSVQETIEQAVLFFESRIILDQVAVDSSESLEGRLSILLDYRIRATNTRSNMVYPFYFREGTDLGH